VGGGGGVVDAKVGGCGGARVGGGYGVREMGVIGWVGGWWGGGGGGGGWVGEGGKESKGKVGNMRRSAL